MIEHAVVIAGAGPTGLMLAGELALAGINVAIVERRMTQELDGSRAGGLHARTIEVLDQRGIADRFLARGQRHAVLGFAGNMLGISDFPTRHNYTLGLWQSHFEPILAEWVAELGVPTLRGCEVVDFSQDDAGVDVILSDHRTLRAEFLVGCDGSSSLVRKVAGIDFVGQDASRSWIIAEVEMAHEPRFGLREGGGIGRAADGVAIRVALPETHLENTREPGLQDVSAALIAVDGTDYGLRSASWISRFTDMSRQASTYRMGRVLLAGDAAHVHPPNGGQGLNTGVQDAVNLGWKLAQVVRKISPESLLDTYHAERHPVGARVLHNTMAQVALNSPGARHQALRETMNKLLGMDEPRKQVVGMVTGLDICYELGEGGGLGHALIGRRMPDLELDGAEGSLRVFKLLHDARPVLLDLGGLGCFDLGPWAESVRLIQRRYHGTWELPVIGLVAAPIGVLVRPDGYVVWAGEQSDAGLSEALSYWFGEPA